MVKSARLESEWAGNRPVSSNLTLSATNFIQIAFSGWRRTSGIRAAERWLSWSGAHGRRGQMTSASWVRITLSAILTLDLAVLDGEAVPCTRNPLQRD